MEINGGDSATDDDRSHKLYQYDKAALTSSRQLDETPQRWLLGPSEQKKKIFIWTVGSILAVGLIIGFIAPPPDNDTVAFIVKLARKHHPNVPPPDNYTVALRKALMFFNAQKLGKLPKHNNVSWRGNSCMNDGKSDAGTIFKDLKGGFYDAGDAIKFNFPASFAMTMLSWSVIEYSAKYEAAGELNHVKETIKWGTDFFLKTFNSSADTIDKLVAQVLMSRLKLFLNPGYPYEEMLQAYHNQTAIIMCSYLPYFNIFKRTKGGLIQLNHGRPQPLQYVVNAAFLATLFSDYLDTSDTPGWRCGPNFYTSDVLREFARTQIDYILGKNPKKMSYLVGFGNHYPKQVFHRAASIPKNKIKYNCKGGWKWRDSKKSNPNNIIGAMVAGPDNHDGFHDVRMNYNYTEPTIAGNAGLVASLVALSGDKSLGIDKNTMFSSVPPMFPNPPPPPAPWKP